MLHNENAEAGEKCNKLRTGKMSYTALRKGSVKNVINRHTLVLMH